MALKEVGSRSSSYITRTSAGMTTALITRTTRVKAFGNIRRLP